MVMKELFSKQLPKIPRKIQEKISTPLKKRWMKQQKRRLETHYSEKKVA